MKLSDKIKEFSEVIFVFTVICTIAEGLILIGTGMNTYLAVGISLFSFFGWLFFFTIITAWAFKGGKKNG